MDAIFLTDDPNTRKLLIGSLAQSFGCVYVCIWSHYFPRPSNYLRSLDGYYNETSQEPSTSSGSLARRLFHEYRQSVIPLQNGHIPSIAFMNNLPYLEISPQDTQRLAYNDAQRHLYQTVIFMGCRSGEIELGLTYDAANMKIGESLREWFPQDFIRKSSPPNSDYLRPQPPPSSSSSSFRSVDSPQNISEFSSPLFPLFPEPSTTTDDAVNVLLHSLLAPVTSTPTGNMIHQQQQESLFRNSKREEEAITKAILAVLTTSSTPPSTSSPPLRKRRATAFKRYYCMDNGGGGSGRAPSSVRKQSMSRRAISFYTRLNIYRRERFARASSTTSGGGDRSGPTATQLHHMISERRRREKLNESFLALRSLLPQGTKKDKISILTIARKQLTSLQGEISKLVERNRELAGEREMENDLQPDERFNVRIRYISESTSRERIFDLRVAHKGANIRADDLMIRLLEMLKQINNVSLVSINAQTRAREDEGTSVVLVSLRLKIEGEWDESSFKKQYEEMLLTWLNDNKFDYFL
ncbi:unnamed protein product [Brassica napus]|uniref:(rape) hypothetical protein n=1 Tax=Brassica napus TaxID=3708 RepID=A0A816J2B8_BRANA|nr:unnamed protein product [Brassica napus]